MHEQIEVSKFFSSQLAISYNIVKCNFQVFNFANSHALIHLNLLRIIILSYIYVASYIAAIVIATIHTHTNNAHDWVMNYSG